MVTTTHEPGTLLRTTTWVWASQLVLTAVYAALAAYWLLAWPGSWRMWIGVCFLVLAAWIGGQGLWLARLRVRMTDDGVAVRGWRGESTYAWHEVRSIQGERRTWTTGQVVTITPHDGAPVTALARGGWFDDGFERNHRQLVDRWRRQAGRDATIA
ncbi:hypothetical protein GXB85_16740 [Cellulomonas sp. APG4]|uniref:PH domain-containing protein n=1 Tax=Cellulomonas sp. APG4 TaxID=1538656 RepID=UPI00137A4B79|nr:PH domain-containing protein [Cellulomonas sp. APG4]NCT92583.1 hypothetical protein [Cellulomonas sp. APG4]